ncbi:helix-turn-helix domain-containing protein [Aestuariispira insulae]|uniref:Xre family transcriptional regulator n=1 Tax=Aestuariispira insulae TaxID=1461337 RepID=A0A3D9HXY6_9PROT|nr:helix-turn-helix domain-containing protein [Aestuariispira insulae]RED54363.1 Xre family transcriptional regulator [Aestuariispira insulae]
MAKGATAGGNPKLGAKIRRLRRDQGKTQAQLADQLGVSASYLNLIEHNHRKVTVDMLLKLSELFQLDLKDLAEGDESQLMADLMAVLSDDLFEELDLTNTDVRELVSTSPNAAKALLMLHDTYRKSLDDARGLAFQLSEETGDESFPLGGTVAPADMVSDFLQNHSNYFQDLEDEADRVRREIGIIETQSNDSLVDYLKTAHGVTVQTVSHEAGEGFQRRYDPAQKLLQLSPRVDHARRNFQLAHQIGLLSAAPVIDMLLTEGRIREGDVRNLGRVALANYFAAALLMPYQAFLDSARAVRYDIELLQHQYGVSFEQTAQRLTSLNKPGNKGIPLHFLRVDIAGNISKRFSLSGLPIPRHGGACSRWNVYSAFMNPGVIQAQMSYLPDGAGFFCIARTVRKGGIGFGVQSSVFSIGLGCSALYAGEMIYSDGIDLDNRDRAFGIGVHCRICDRMDCGQRASPPVHQRFRVDENVRGLSPYAYAGWPHHHRELGGTR